MRSALSLFYTELWSWFPAKWTFRPGKSPVLRESARINQTRFSGCHHYQGVSLLPCKSLTPWRQRPVSIEKFRFYRLRQSNESFNIRNIRNRDSPEIILILKIEHIFREYLSLLLREYYLGILPIFC